MEAAVAAQNDAEDATNEKKESKQEEFTVDEEGYRIPQMNSSKWKSELSASPMDEDDRASDSGRYRNVCSTPAITFLQIAPNKNSSLTSR